MEYIKSIVIKINIDTNKGDYNLTVEPHEEESTDDFIERAKEEIEHFILDNYTF